MTSNMKMVELMRARIAYSWMAFAELMLWRVPRPVAGSTHRFKYRLAYVVNGLCVLRYDNEGGKGNHHHIGDTEHAYAFSTPDRLLADI